MIIIHSLNLFYVRVPKTGSTSFVNALDHLDPEHLGGVHDNCTGARRLLRRRFNNDWRHFRRVGFIRHPYQWARSAFAHWKRNPDSRLFTGPFKPRSLGQFVHCLQKTPYEWLCEQDGTLFCEIWRTEDMPEIMDRLGLELRHNNVKFVNPYNPSPVEKEQIQQRFARDFEAGNYEK